MGAAVALDSFLNCNQLNSNDASRELCANLKAESSGKDHYKRLLRAAVPRSPAVRIVGKSVVTEGTKRNPAWKGYAHAPSWKGHATEPDWSGYECAGRQSTSTDWFASPEEYAAAMNEFQGLQSLSWRHGGLKDD